MYEHVTRFIDEIEYKGFERAGELDGEITHALYEPEVIDRDHRKTLDSYCLEGERPWLANVESLDLKATLALLTWVQRADHFCEGTMADCLGNGFVYRILLRLRELDGGEPRPNLIGFWHEKDSLGCCSNWHPTGLVFAGRHFATSEHWMMWQKACVMGDLETADQILDAPHPRRAKELGVGVKPYDGQLWDAVREQLVYVGVREKFTQSPRLANLLLSTGSATLAEASPYDHVWGVGLTTDDPCFADPCKWKGSNLLGRVCMRVRADLRTANRCDVDLASLSRHDDDMVFSLYRDQVGSMTLAELSRVPAARPAVLCYARIAQYNASDVFLSVDDFLASVGQGTVATIDGGYRTNMGGGLSVAGWRELVSQLAFMRSVGQL